MHLRFSCPTEAGAKIRHLCGVAAYWPGSEMGVERVAKKLFERQDVQTSDDVHFTAISGKVLDRWQREPHPLQTVITEHVAVIWTDSRWSRRTACHRSVSQSLPHRAWLRKTQIIVYLGAGGNVPWRGDMWERHASVWEVNVFQRVTPGWGFKWGDVRNALWVIEWNNHKWIMNRMTDEINMIMKGKNNASSGIQAYLWSMHRKALVTVLK